MAYALSNTNTNAGFGFSTKLNELADAWRTARAKRAVFNRTFNELNMLDDRALADIGLARSELRALAWDLAAKAV